MSETPSIVELRAEQTHPLRLAVLRTGTPTRDVVFTDDALPTTLHLGVELDGQIVTVSSWAVRRHPDKPTFTGVQLRGMATAPEQRGRGFGALLLEAGVERAFDGGHDLVWARARDTALAFYERHGFKVFGRGYLDMTTELPHHDIVRRHA